MNNLYSLRSKIEDDILKLREEDKAIYTFFINSYEELLNRIDDYVFTVDQRDVISAIKMFEEINKDVKNKFSYYGNKLSIYWLEISRGKMLNKLK